MTRPVEVGKRIRELREDTGLTLQELAQRTGYSSALLSQFENHMVSPPLGALIRLSRALAVDVGDFFGEVADQSFILVRSDERETVSRVASKEGVSLGYTYEDWSLCRYVRSICRSMRVRSLSTFSMAG
jgi:transcriptional regulator with XRE-family HTH domain